MGKSNAYKKGIALVSTLVFLFIVIVLISIATLTSLSNRRNAQDALRTSQAQFAAEAGLERALVKIWHEALAEAPSRSPKGYAIGLNRIGLANGNTIHLGPQDLGDGSSFAVEISRQDDKDTSGDIKVINLNVTSTGTLADGTTRRLRQTFWVERASFPFDYAMLTNKADCIFCHLDVKSIDALRGPPTSDPSTWWRRTKVGVLENLIMLEENIAGDIGVVHGSLVTRGTIAQRLSGATGPSNGYRTTLRPGETRIRSADPIRATPADCSTPSNCTTPQNVYYNYPTSDNLAAFGNRFPDGELPDKFPLPIPDTNNNRLIDDFEWNAEVSSSLAGTNEVYTAGSLTAVMTTNPSSTWPRGVAQTKGSADLGLNRTNLLLDGSVTPITINGTVFVNGDVVLRGFVRGNGTLLARGNVYVMGDLIYDCGTGSTLAPCDYSNPSRLPQLNLIAGGNLLVGDYMSPPSMGYKITPQQLLDPNLIQPTMSFCQRNPNDSICRTSSWGPHDRPLPNLTVEEMANFNREELRRYLRDNSYRPRFYTFGEDKIYFTTGCAHEQPYWEYGTIAEGARVSFCIGEWRETGSVTLTATQARDILARAARYEITSSAFSNVTLKKLWIDSINARGSGPLRTDGLLYSANAIFSVAQPKYEKLNGRWDLRGAMVAADTGVLAPRGLTIYHDYRLRPRLPGGQQAQLKRGTWEVIGQ